jgi:CRP/FNR family transcriptional regulator/CRP/FNR family cyclic AMP-dependent transcriptional regulator
MAVADHLFWRFGQDFGEDETLFREGDESLEMYIVVEGSVEIIKEHNGHCDVLATLGEGEFFGEMALLSGDKRSATALVRRGSRLLVVGKDTFISLLKDSGEVSLMMLNKLTERLRETTVRLNDSVGALLRNSLVLYVLARGPLKWPEERPGLAAFCGVAEGDADAVVDFLVERGILTLSGGELAAADADALLEGLGAAAPAVACSVVNNRSEP